MSDSKSLADKMTRRQKHLQSANPRTMFQVYTNKSTVYCEAWCSCACHKKTAIRLKQPFQSNKFGSLTFSYSGLPWITAECDEKRSCSSRSLPSISTTIHFPTWFWKSYISTSITFNPLNGPNLNVKMPHTVDWTTKLWDLGRTRRYSCSPRSF